jgi:AcrR family transcriptional regulator
VCPDEKTAPGEGLARSPRAERKLEQMMEGARAVLVAKGFEGASVDDIAREAGISKATMYRYFPDKTALFRAVMSRECARQAAAAVDVGDCGGPVEPLLVDFATRHLSFVLSDFAVDVFRTAVAESARFPGVGRDFYDGRLLRAQAALVPLVTAAAERGEIVVEDGDRAAAQLLALCKADLFFRRLFGLHGPYSDEEIAAEARRAVAAFLRIYRPA